MKKQIPYIKDNYGIRKITPQECLTLLGFPKGYSFLDTMPLKEQYKQCGNSIAVLLIKNIISQNHFLTKQNNTTHQMNPMYKL